MSLPERQNCESYTKEGTGEKKKKQLRLHTTLPLISCPEKQPLLGRAESQKSAEIHQVRVQMGTGRGIQNQGSRGKWCWIWTVGRGFNRGDQKLCRTPALLLGGDGLHSPAGSCAPACDTPWIESPQPLPGNPFPGGLSRSVWSSGNNCPDTSDTENPEAKLEKPLMFNV